MNKSLIRLSKGILLVFFFLGILISQNAYSALTAPAQDEIAGDPHSTNDLSRGNVTAFKDSYVPKEYHPMPEFMVFVDLAVLILLIVAGLFFVLKRKSGRPMHILMIITFVYLAFIRGGCICPVGVIANTVMGIVEPALVGLATLIVFLVPLITALVGGRVFCSSGCPLGALQHLGTRKNNRKYLKIPRKLNTALKIAPVIILGLTVYYATQIKACFFACELDPYKAIFFTGQSWFEQGLAYIAGRPMEAKILIAGGLGTWIYLLIILAIGYWIPRPFCRFICPYGVLLGAVSVFAYKRRGIDTENCVYCGLCQKVCPTQAITIDRKKEIAKLSNYDCVQCNKCNESCKKNAIL